MGQLVNYQENANETALKQATVSSTDTNSIIKNPTRKNWLKENRLIETHANDIAIIELAMIGHS